jgi:hypothetical protein
MKGFTAQLRRDYCRAYTSFMGIDAKVRCRVESLGFRV